MLNLLTNYSGTEILTFIVILALAIKGVINFYDWAVERVKKIFKKETLALQEKEEILERLEKLEKEDQNINAQLEAHKGYFNKITDKIDILINSDKDAIKSYIIDKHHYFCYQKKWIDDYSLDVLERRYKHYKAENGNSFVHDLMEEIRALDKFPPDRDKK